MNRRVNLDLNPMKLLILVDTPEHETGRSVRQAGAILAQASKPGVVVVSQPEGRGLKSHGCCETQQGHSRIVTLPRPRIALNPLSHLIHVHWS